EEHLSLLELITRIVEFLDDHDTCEPIGQLDLDLRPIHAGREGRGGLEDLAERRRVSCGEQEGGQDERDHEHAEGGPHVAPSDAVPERATRLWWSDQAIRPTKRTTGRNSIRRNQAPV